MGGRVETAFLSQGEEWAVGVGNWDVGLWELASI